MSDRIYLIDGSGYIFRAYYALPPLSSKDGTPTNAVIGFARMLGKLLQDTKPKELAIAFDTKEKNFRHTLFKKYKANRDAPPDDLVPQFALISELVEAMNIPLFKIPGYEADDILATLAQKAESEGKKVTIVSADKDLMQLVTDNINLFDPMKNKTFEKAEVLEKFGVLPEFVADLLALAGDTSDNIPGVPKIGPKTAAKLIHQYGDVEAIIQGVQGLEKHSSAEKSILEHQEDARLSKKLALLTRLEALEKQIEKTPLEYSKPHKEALKAFLERMDARNLQASLGLSSEEKIEPLQISNYQLITELQALKSFVAQAEKNKCFCIDLETTSLDAHSAHIVGFALATDGLPAAYIPVGHQTLEEITQLKLADVLNLLRPICTAKDILKIGHNIKYDITVLSQAGKLELEGLIEDTMLQAYVLNPVRRSFSMDALAMEELNHETISYQSLTGKGQKQITFDQVPIEQAKTYAAEDADVTLRLYKIFTKQLQAYPSLEKVYRELELPTLKVLCAMEREGIWIDCPFLKSLSKEFSLRLTDIQAQAEQLAGGPINLASPKQLSNLFFDKLHFPIIKKTKTGNSTDQEVLEVLAETYELPRVVLEHRTLSKLCSTYIDSLPLLVNPRTKRLHTHYHQTGTSTGRLSSSNPNLQNIPIRGEDGIRIRKAFQAQSGWKLLSADYSQIELRILAHLCEDPKFIQAFQNKEDIHRRTAMEVLTDGREPTSDERRRAKTINFGLIYGQSEFGLSKQLGISRQTAKEYMETYFNRYPAIDTYFSKTIEDARSNGYVETLLGRRRDLPDLRNKNALLRQGAERIAKNSPIQGSAADIMKLAMIALYDALNKNKLQSRILLQVHDELIVESPEEEVQEVQAIITQAMTGVMKLHVPLDIEIGIGKSWAEAH